MEMSKGEIRRSYRQAKNKARQLGILADLNDCSRAEIERILGVEQKKKKSIEEVMEGLFKELDDIESQISALNERYQKVAITLEVLGGMEDAGLIQQQ